MIKTSLFKLSKFNLFFFIIKLVETNWYIIEIKVPIAVQKGVGIKEETILKVFAICLFIVALI